MKKLKNIVIYYPSFEKGGATFNLINFINQAAKKNIYISLISNIDKKNEKKFLTNKIKVFRVKSTSKYFLSKRITSLFGSLLILIKLLITSNRDTIFFSFQSHIIPLFFCAIFLKKIVIRNSEDAINATKYADNFISAYIVLFLKSFFYFFANGIITNSLKSKNSLKKLTFNIKNVNLIYNPYLHKILKYKKKNRKKIILSVGRLCKQKNQSLTIKAFKIFTKYHRDYKLVIVGHGADKDKLKKLIKKLNLQNSIIIKDWQSNMNKYYSTSKLLVFPSLYEGLPNTLIDALNYSLPCITTKCSGAEDILSKNYNYFVKHDDTKKLGVAMSDAILNYNAIMNSTKKQHTKLKRFLVPNQVNKYLKFLTTILNK